VDFQTYAVTEGALTDLIDDKKEIKKIAALQDYNPLPQCNLDMDPTL